MICPNVNAPNFCCCVPDDPLNQRVFQYLNLGSTILTQDVSLSGSIWTRSGSSIISFLQSEYYIEDGMSNPIAFAQLASAVIDRPGEASSNLLITDSFVFAGTAAIPPTDPPVVAIFDSDTLKGMAVYISGDGHVDLAKANAASTATVVGIANENVTAGNIGTYLTEGQITQSDWTAIIGVGSLVPGTIYFLSETNAGQLVSAPPEIEGEFVVRVSRALTNTTLDIEISQPVIL